MASSASGKEEERGPRAGSLYGDMMRGIRSGHSRGNTIRMLKLPLVLTEEALYAEAIAQFYLLTLRLEKMLERHKGNDLVDRVRSLGLRVTPGYKKDLKELMGPSWMTKAVSAATPATMDYCAELEAMDAEETVAASFILYGALVVGGGKSTQAKVRKIFPKCKHALFDVGEDMKALRADFKSCFDGIGHAYPELREKLVSEATRFMALNNTVILSIKCWGTYATYASLAAAALALAALLTWKRSLLPF